MLNADHAEIHTGKPLWTTVKIERAFISAAPYLCASVSLPSDGTFLKGTGCILSVFPGYCDQSRGLQQREVLMAAFVKFGFSGGIMNSSVWLGREERGSRDTVREERP